MQPDQPDGRALCGAFRPITGVVCALLAGHGGRHTPDGIEWWMQEGDRAAYDRGLAEGRRQATEEHQAVRDAIERTLDQALGTGLGSGAGEGLAADVQLLADRYATARQATEGWERRWAVEEPWRTPFGCDDEADAREAVAHFAPGSRVVSRLVGPWEPARAVVEQDEPEQSNDRLNRDLDALAVVGRMYLDALDADPENEMLTLPQAIRVTEVREAVERREAAWEPAEQPEAEDGHRD